MGKQAPTPSSGITSGFIAASILGLILSPFLLESVHFTVQGVLLAVASGAIASGCGYVLWYQVMQKLTLLQAAISQLSVPAIAVILGNVLLGETLTLHSLITSAVILGGIALVFLSRSQKSKTNPASQ